MLLSLLAILSLFLVDASSLVGGATSMHSSSSSNTIKNVVVVGGTHGNEYTGVWCIKALDRTCEKVNAAYPSLDISTLLANPEAHMKNKRFVDEDLNRQFSQEKLSAIDDSGVPLKPTVESLRAQELNALLGPKSNPKTDVIVDLHSTTSNMGLTLIIPEGDDLMAAAAAYVMLKCGLDDTRCLMHSHPSRNSRPNLSSTAKHGFTIEVGPVPQGVLRYDAVDKTEQAIHALLDFLQQRNDSSTAAAASDLKKAYPNNRVPCFRSAPAQQPGEMSGKIQWPCDPENPNFPTYLIHPNVQDNDFSLVYKGDPLFIDLEGKDIPYTGSHGSPVHLMFVNEGGYYYASSGTGIGVAVPAEFDLETGLLVTDEHCHANGKVTTTEKVLEVVE